MKSKNQTVIMSIIDGVLQDTIWVNKQGKTTSLKEVLVANIGERFDSGLENLNRDDLSGAYTSFQIKRQMFAESITNMTNKEIADRIKLFIFEETHNQMKRVNEYLGLDKDLVRKTA